ncbi:ATP-binding cassette domain-containing protein [Alicyclobacillaceae bacterium I2511]|nr:ATP-binding cassette domain-containing protein [Alicyclobacillaceae bacterium I2511]
METQISPADTEAIRFEHVCKEFIQGSQKAPVSVLKDVSGVVQKGSVVTLVGPSGAGKSTLLSLCNLLLTPDEGRIFLAGTEVRVWPVQELRRHAALVFQSPVVFPGTVLENLEFGLKLQGKRLDNPEHWLQQVGLPTDILEQQAEDLSGGQKQRVALVRVLVTEPRILLLDEVTSALDVSAAREVEEWLLTWQRQTQNTVLWVTHHLEQARRVGDWTWLFVAGRVVEQAPTDVLFTHPQMELTQRFLRGELSGGGIS